MSSYSCGTVVLDAMLKHSVGVDVGFSCLRFWQVVFITIIIRYQRDDVMQDVSSQGEN